MWVNVMRRITINFHKVDWTNLDSFVVYSIGKLLGHDMRLVHVSITVEGSDGARYNIDYSRYGLQMPSDDELQNIVARVVLDDEDGDVFDLLTGRFITASTMRIKLSLFDILCVGLRIEPAGFVCTTFTKYLLGMDNHKEPCTALELYRMLGGNELCLESNSCVTSHVLNAEARTIEQYSSTSA